MVVEDITDKENLKETIVEMTDCPSQFTGMNQEVKERDSEAVIPNGLCVDGSKVTMAGAAITGIEKQTYIRF